jgi:hypothetical protein
MRLANAAAIQHNFTSIDTVLAQTGRNQLFISTKI